MKKKRFSLARRFFKRFNPWLFLVCVLLAILIWCTTMYVQDPSGLRSALAMSPLF